MGYLASLCFGKPQASTQVNRVNFLSWTVIFSLSQAQIIVCFAMQSLTVILESLQSVFHKNARKCYYSERCLVTHLRYCFVGQFGIDHPAKCGTSLCASSQKFFFLTPTQAFLLYSVPNIRNSSLIFGKKAGIVSAHWRHLNHKSTRSRGTIFK